MRGQMNCPPERWVRILTRGHARATTSPRKPVRDTLMHAHRNVRNHRWGVPPVAVDVGTPCISSF
jgi:hypothetical protein